MIPFIYFEHPRELHFCGQLIAFMHFPKTAAIDLCLRL
jgi:hypothetical protein